MARILVTGSTDGVGRNAAQALIAQGHEVVLHARNVDRAETLADIADRASGVVTGDLASLAETRMLAEQINDIGQMDAIIHNAGLMDGSREITGDGLLRVLMVNALAPYMLSILVARPARLIFTGSSMHFGHDAVLGDMEWKQRSWSGSNAYGESKLLVSALSAALARHWPETLCNNVDPGWVPTKMGGRSASDDLQQAHVTQCWLAISDEEDAKVSGGYWHHMRRLRPDPKVEDEVFQETILASFARMTGVTFQ
ncbi:SDR family oxidoreductase [Altericroceibacterium spongiae]|uniref:SDR family oxidoreductase n=1 Tax=Altericroceibacterium spongiae TaxID=2320269 RepID=A0A420EMC0_9SPHN|nr:SDR family NAD(P)-dependent oxidoreductase [Altericroceibacterium spongiae]RKF21766.1 SDR family oxidoreductase [Altericroceibacterium spongiae]